jgi:predicted acyltransferase
MSTTTLNSPTDAVIPKPTSNRLTSIDTYRGFVMLLMLSEVLKWEDIAEKVPGNAFLEFMAFHQSHVSWQGCSLHDMIQPSFTFLVGVAMPFSLASRASHGQTPQKRALHAIGRALTLVLLGVLLRSLGKNQTYWTFEDTLSQIGLGYAFLYGIAHLKRHWQWLALVVILFGYWLAFALTPLPPPGFDPASVGVKPDWNHHVTGFAAHWDKNTNLAMQVEIWLRNTLPHEEPFKYNGGGYAALSFIPTLGTMILGLIAGNKLRETGTTARGQLQWFAIAGVIGIAAGSLLDQLGICPVVKRIWTPSWVLFSGGICFWMLAAFRYLVDIKGFTKPAFPLVVIGVNSIAAYVMSWFFTGMIEDALYRHFGKAPFEVFGHAYETLLHGGATLLIVWGILHWMQKNKIFLRI